MLPLTIIKSTKKHFPSSLSAIAISINSPHITPSTPP